MAERKHDITKFTLSAAIAAAADPIFGAIEADRAASAAFDANFARLNSGGTPEAKAELAGLRKAVRDADDALIEVKPTSMPGVIALLRHVAGEEASGNEMMSAVHYEDEQDPALKGKSAPWSYFLHRNLANAIERLWRQ